MGGESASTTTVQNLPLPLRAALDLVVLRCGGRAGPPRGRPVGLPRLVEALRAYGWMDDPDGPLVALGLAADDLAALVAATAPERVIVLADGRLAAAARPFRAGGANALPPPPRLPAWHALGYEPRSVDGCFGPAALGWAAGDHVLRRLDRPDLADRCRIGMLRSVVAAPFGRPLTLATVVAYRRSAA